MFNTEIAEKIEISRRAAEGKSNIETVLAGTEKQINWAYQIRQENTSWLLKKSFEVTNETASELKVAFFIKTLNWAYELMERPTEAKFWIENQNYARDIFQSELAQAYCEAVQEHPKATAEMKSKCFDFLMLNIMSGNIETAEDKKFFNQAAIAYEKMLNK